jgi:SAM-dependent methyltransferase
MQDYHIPLMKRLVNEIAFPFRCLFKHQGFGSYIMSMDEDRMVRVARYCKGRVLDVGCGPHNKFIKNVYHNGLGIDFFPYDGVEVLHDDPTNLPYEDESFDTITLNAVGGHIPQNLRKKEFKEFSRIIKAGGRLVMTEGEPITQYLHHRWVHFLDTYCGTNVDVDTERGMHEEEQYAMPHEEILMLFKESGLTHIKTEKFQWRLNNVFVAEKR